MPRDAVSSLLLASPPGQFDLVLEDLQSIASKSMPDAGCLSDIRAKWEESTGYSILKSSAVDITNEEVTDGCIYALRNSLDNYMGNKFSSQGVHAANQVQGDKSMITIEIYASRIDLHNHNAGSWKATYSVNPSSGCISGSVSITAHTFENGGNVQLHSDICLDETDGADCIIPNEDGEKLESWAKSVVKRIQAWEDTEVMSKFDEMYERMNNEYLKSLRRVMPITRTKMEWNVMAHRVRTTLGEGHDKDKFKH